MWNRPLRLLPCVLVALLLSGSVVNVSFSRNISEAADATSGTIVPAANNPTSKVLEGLRKDARDAQVDYIDTLRDVKSGSASEYVELLRSELRLSVQTALQSSTRSEVLLALKRASVDFKVEKINALEQAVGEPDGLLTTRWNVFTRAELAGLEHLLRTEYSNLLIEAARYSAASTPLKLVGRIDEVGTELDALVAEKMLRGDVEVVQLRRISSTMTFVEAEQRATQLKLEPEQVRAERALLLQVEQGLRWHPQDPGLTSLSRGVRSGPMKLPVLRLIAERSRPDGWPPSRERPPDSVTRRRHPLRTPRTRRAGVQNLRYRLPGKLSQILAMQLKRS